MEKYIDGYLLSWQRPAAYKKMAGLARTVWLEHGALDYRECRGDELDNEAFASFTSPASRRNRGVRLDPVRQQGRARPTTRWP